MKYYLVSPLENNPEGANGYFWMTDNGDTWIGVARGIWRKKHPQDIIKEIIEAEHISHLDWMKTPFHDNTMTSGWLSRSGNFFGCPTYYHDIIAAIVLDMKVGDLEKTGWTRVLNSSRYYCEKRLSSDQENWLAERGYKLPDSI